METANIDKDVLDLENLKSHASHASSQSTTNSDSAVETTFSNLEQQLRAAAESVSVHPVVVEDNRDDLVQDVENPVIHDKLTTITSQVKTEQHHEVGERPDQPPFDEFSINGHEKQENIEPESSEEKEEATTEQKPTPKVNGTGSGSTRLWNCTDLRKYCAEM